jgi:hypothetical protein
MYFNGLQKTVTNCISHHCALNNRTGGPQSSSGRGGVKKNFCRDTNPGRPAHDSHSTGRHIMDRQAARKHIQNSDGETFRKEVTWMTEEMGNIKIAFRINWL